MVNLIEDLVVGGLVITIYSIGVVGPSSCDQILATKKQLINITPELSFFPNPVHNYLSWSTLNDQFSADIFDVHGRKIKASYAHSFLDPSSLNRGLYFLQIKN